MRWRPMPPHRPASAATWPRWPTAPSTGGRASLRAPRRAGRTCGRHLLNEREGVTAPRPAGFLPRSPAFGVTLHRPCRRRTPPGFTTSSPSETSLRSFSCPWRSRFPSCCAPSSGAGSAARRAGGRVPGRSGVNRAGGVTRRAAAQRRTAQPLTRPARGGIRAVLGVGVAVLVTVFRLFS